MSCLGRNVGGGASEGRSFLGLKRRGFACMMHCRFAFFPRKGGAEIRGCVCGCVQVWRPVALFLFFRYLLFLLLVWGRVKVGFRGVVACRGAGFEGVG